jgi:hypothetical protein
MSMRITEDMRITRQRQLIYIVTAPLVDSLREEDFPMPQPPLRFYPDGSLWTDDNRRLLCTNRRGVLEEPKALIGSGGSSFCPLAAFGGDQDDATNYQILYPQSCDWMGEHENWALTYPVNYYDKGLSDEQYDLAHVRVLIRLRRKFTEEVAEELAGMLRQWFTEIGSQGVFGEAGVKSISPEMRWLDRSAGFELDARGSGQETLNTLYLAVLNWGMNQRRPLVLTDLAADISEPVYASRQSAHLA